ncbi:MAG: YihY/virulence factor BrkB family protein [Bernardetiaceae bacterium]|nr:YihY/virulence factor BrkB family protein [Bernardetiaceae bacterium]
MFNKQFHIAKKIGLGIKQRLEKVPLSRRNRHYNLWLVLAIFTQKVVKDNILDRAYSVAFNLTLAIFPFVIFLFTLIPYIPIENLDDRIFTELRAIMPYGIYRFIDTTLQDIVSRPRAGLLSFGFFVATFAATSGVVAFMNAFNYSYRIHGKRGVIKQRFIALGLTIAFSLVLLLTTVLLVVGEQILALLLYEQILTQDLLYYSIQIMRYLVSIIAIYFVISLLFYIGPDEKIRWNLFSKGVILATILTVLGALLFSTYISYFGTYNKLYGSIGTFIGFMLWLFLTSYIILIGFELNVSLDKAHRIAARKLRS